MTVETKLSVSQDYVHSFSQEKGEPEWFTKLRVDAFQKADELPMPRPDKTRITTWNFTQFAKHSVESEVYSSLEALPETVRSLIELENESKNLYIQHNQTSAFLSISDDLKAKGVIFTDIITAIKEHSELVQKYFMQEAVKINEHKLTALHAALMNGGVFLYIPKNVEISEPVQTVYVHDHDDAPLFNHVLVVADDNSSVTIVENYVSTNEKANGIVNIITELVANSGAKISYGAVDTLAEGVTTYVNRRGFAKRDAHIEWALGMMNDGNTISDNTTKLVGDGSFAHSKTVVVGRGKQTQNFTTQITHFGKNTEGFILKHGVMKDAASSIFNGIGKIEHGATKSNAEQESRVLMLSEKARGDANPIFAY